MTSVTHLEVDEIDLSDPGFWIRPEHEREAAFATLRTERPISFFAEPEFGDLPRGPGYWAITRYDIQVTGPPDMLQSAFIHGIKRMPCAFTPA